MQHPGIVQIYEIGEHSGQLYLALELVEGGNLRRKIAGQPQDPRWSAAVVMHLARTVHFAHQEGVVHRDLKPENIMLSLVPGHTSLAGGAATNDEGQLTKDLPRITDFGLAKQANSASDLTKPGMMAGTLAYRKPNLAAVFACCTLFYGLHLLALGILAVPHHQGFFHWFLTALLLGWCVAAMGLQRWLDDPRRRERGRYLFAGLTALVVTASCTADDGPSSSPISAYLVLIAGSVLLLPRPRMIWITTGLSVAAYAWLTIHAYCFRPASVVSPENSIAFTISLVSLGLIPRSAKADSLTTPLPLAEGRKLYEQHVARPRVTGGVRKSTQKKYRSVLDKFLPFATSRDVTTWNGVTAELLNAYVADLEAKDYAHKTQSNELITLKQAVKYFILKHLRRHCQSRRRARDSGPCHARRNPSAAGRRR